METPVPELGLSFKPQAAEEPARAAIALLQQLIAQPSPGGKEDKTAQALLNFFSSQNIPVRRKHNNVWACNKYFNPALPSILLNSHHDTVLPVAGYTRDPFDPEIRGGKLFGLGSNDAGGALVSLLAAFLHFHDKKLKYNLVFSATAEEETSGINGFSSILGDLGKIDFAIVGEPTRMQMAIAEKGLMVLDCVTTGTSSHAAHDNADNAIYKAVKDIEWFRKYKFPGVSPLLGEVHMTVTVIDAGKQHNVVPGQCRFTVDVRTNELYANDEILDVIRKNVASEVIPRSLRLNSSRIDPAHPVVRAGLAAGCSSYGSPTLSDQALMPFPSVKIGPGDSARSHTGDEFIYIDEIYDGIEKYIQILSQLL